MLERGIEDHVPSGLSVQGGARSVRVSEQRAGVGGEGRAQMAGLQRDWILWAWRGRNVGSSIKPGALSPFLKASVAQKSGQKSQRSAVISA